MYSEGFQLIINTAASCLNTVIIPAGAFGDHGSITFWNILVLGLGALFSIKFLRYCLGGSFNMPSDKVKINYNKEEERVDLNTRPLK